MARAARAEMRRLASSTAYGLADSTYNALELTDEGYPDTAVVPILLDFAEYDAAPDTATLTRLRRRAEAGGAHWLFVGRVAANKCQHDIIAAFAAYRQLFDPKARLSIVGGRTLLLYARALERLADELGVADAVDFTDNLKFPQLLAHYRAADLFVSLSEHEGFCVPLVEAMHFGVPTVAYASTAVPETVGDATLLLPDKDPLTVAVAAQRVLSDDVVRKASDRGRAPAGGTLLAREQPTPPARGPRAEDRRPWVRPAMGKGRIAFVPPRYGDDVVGGAETVLRQAAERLAARGWEVEILTTCVRDHYTWANAYPPGTEPRRRPDRSAASRSCTATTPSAGTPSSAASGSAAPSPPTSSSPG